MLPHLDHDRVNEFRWALFAGLGVILVLYVAGLITAAILVAALLIPLLYVLYLYEVRTYRDAPRLIFALTMGAGIALGAVATVLLNLIRPGVPALQSSPFGLQVDVLGFLVTAAAIPIAQEIIKPIPALLLRTRPEFGQTIDGLVFGVAAGLGFALAQTIVQFADVFVTLDVRTDPADWLFPLTTFGLLLPVLHGSSTGIITATLWRTDRQDRGRLAIGAVLAAVASQVAFAGGSQIVAAAGLGQPVVLVWQAIVMGALLVYVRYVLHRALLEEATEFGFERIQCPNCRETVTADAFCPSCGMALSAATAGVHGVPRSESTGEPVR
jgi:RsiW-degrading membrane proteinase PrsW (M82 family)